MLQKKILLLFILWAGFVRCGENTKEDIGLLLAAISPQSETSTSPTDPDPDTDPGTVPDPEPNPNWPLIVSNTVPYNNASLVNITSSVSVKFSEAVDPSSILVNVTGSDCSGSFQISSDGFHTCLKLNPVSESLDGNKTFSFKPADEFTGGTTYRFKLTDGIKSVSGKSLLHLGDYSFKTSIPGNKSFAVSSSERIYRTSFLSHVDYASIDIKVRPTEETRIIRQIVLVAQYKDANGVATQVKYRGLGDLDKMYYSDEPGEQIISMSLKDFTPKLDIHSNWASQRRLRIGANVVYSDGSFGTSLNSADILLVDDATSSFDAFGYSAFLFINVAPFVPTASDRPKNEWKSWIEASYPDGGILKSRIASISASGSGVLSMDLLRPKSGTKETLKFHLDSTGDGIADYTWNFSEFDIPKNGILFFGDAIGTRQNDTNQPSGPIQLE